MTRAGERFRVLEGDMFERLEDVGAGTVQMALLDPPYMVGSVSAAEKGRIGPWGDLMNGGRFFRDVIDAIRPKLAHGGCMWAFGNWRGLPSLYKGACDAGFVPSGCLVWDKEAIGQGALMRSQWELAMLLVCDGFERRSCAFADVQHCKPVPPNARSHPAEKPVALVKQMIEFGSDPGDLILDTFCGSGTTGVAAAECGRRFIGIEIDPGHCEKALERVRYAYAQGRLFDDPASEEVSL